MNRSNSIMPPAIALVALVTMIVLHAVAPLTIVVSPPLSCAGALLTATGTIVVLLSRRTFQVAGTPREPGGGSQGPT